MPFKLDPAHARGFEVSANLCNNGPEDIRVVVAGLNVPAVIKRVRGTSRFTH